jgi:hypothetical protein
MMIIVDLRGLGRSDGRDPRLGRSIDEERVCILRVLSAVGIGIRLQCFNTP